MTTIINYILKLRALDDLFLQNLLRSAARVRTCALIKIMANKTTRKKFRPPLKTPNSSQPYSLLCSQTSTATSGASGVGESQDRGKESSQSWLSQLTTAESTCTGAKNPLVTATTPALITATGSHKHVVYIVIGLLSLSLSLSSHLPLPLHALLSKSFSTLYITLIVTHTHTHTHMLKTS